MASMSFSNAPDEATLGRVAGALGVEESFVEKDWYVVQAITRLIGLKSEYLTPVFSGGTSLLKAYGLIRRFSEDIDFKFRLSEDFLTRSRNQQRTILGTFREALVGEWASTGFEITSVQSRDANGFLKIEMDYPSRLQPHDSLRPHILAEFSAKPPRMPVQDRSIGSFVSEYAASDPEVPSISCVDPVETAADKLSAFAWRMLSRNRTAEDDDPTIARHLHDLAALEATVSASGIFPSLLSSVLEDDNGRGGEALAALPPKDRLAEMGATLARDELYEGEYDLFVGGMAFAGEGEVPSFETAKAAVERLCKRLAD